MKTLLCLLAVSALLVAPAGAQVVINEMVTAVPDWCEVANLGSAPVNIGGWTLVMADDPNVTEVFAFPAGTTIAPGEAIVVTESATGPVVPVGTQVFVTTGNINWSETGAGACGLNAAGSAGRDLVLFGNPVNIPPQNPASPFVGSLGFSGRFYRRTGLDTDTSLDWSSGLVSSATPGLLEPGQISGPLNANFAAINPAVSVGESVVFADQSTGVATSWAWDLDGDSLIDSTVASPSFIYSAGGTYSVTLTVTNAFGSDSFTRTNYVTVTQPTSASVPYNQDFTSALGGEWDLQSTGTGRIAVQSDNSPLSGGNALVFDSSVSGSFGTNTATLTVDLAATGGGILRYYAKESGDEADPEDGVFLSDGLSTVKVVDHAGLTSSWQELTVDLTQAAVANGLVLGSSFEIIFSQRDNYPVPTDGLFIDDIRVTPPPVPDVGQANSADAYLDLNGGLNINLNPAFNGENGPFFASGNSLDFTVKGAANQPWILVVGNLQRNTLVGTFGSLDVDFNGLQIVMDGSNPVTLFDQLAFVGPSGESQMSFGTADLPVGILGTFQAVVFTTDPANPFVLSAATEFSVTP